MSPRGLAIVAAIFAVTLLVERPADDGKPSSVSMRRMIVSVLARGGSVEIQIALRHSRSAQKIADRFDAFLIKCAVRFGSDTRDYFDAERREKIFFRTGGHIDKPARLCQGCGDFGRQSMS